MSDPNDNPERASEETAQAGTIEVSGDQEAPLVSDADIAALEETLAAFAQNPSQVLNRPIQKFDGDGNPVSPYTPFAQADIASRRFIQASDEYRKEHSMEHDGVIVSLAEVMPGRAPYAGNDRAENLVDELKYTKLSSMHAARLRAATLPVQPWSDDYWGLFQGTLGCRYGDESYPKDLDWGVNHRYVQQRSAADIFAAGDAAAIDKLSPSEKYDLLVGDRSGTLTERMWEMGRYYYERDGKVEPWMGICHGWSPAAYMLARPRRAVDVVAPDGTTKIRFYPADIKALASLLWAQVAPNSRFIGGRFNEPDPEQDSNGRIIAQSAFDTNPGTLHLSVVNQIGVSQRSFVIDATYDYEVWNQPVSEYKYSYFNPLTRKFSASLTRAQVAYDDFKSEDKFKKYRSDDVRSIVGVYMQLSYMVEVHPRQRDVDGPGHDAFNTAKYMYDLELD
ncbi:MAG: hypothetical protein KC636_15420, partial [Myxococcales bacterium]|nr:hypothetical protein [Myxococcales bacterium]